MLILHISTQADWEAAQTSGFYTGNTLSTEGFIHAATPDQLMHVLTKHFPNIVNHIILELDTEKVRPQIRWEGASEVFPRGFPHIYGPLNIDAVTRYKQLW